MSKPRYDWWPYVKGMIRRWPKLKEKYSDLHSQSVVASLSGMPSGTSVSRSTENVALRELPTTEQREFEAVRKAIETTERYDNGLDRLRIINLVLWKQTHTIEGAADMVHCSCRTARRWHSEFIRTVAAYYGLMDGER